jgi:hypothetical protein
MARAESNDLLLLLAKIPNKKKASLSFFIQIFIAAATKKKQN